MKIITIHKSAIDRFCATWPCHGIPAVADHIVAAFDDGDFIDFDTYDADGFVIEMGVIEENTWGSGALPALFDDALQSATVTSNIVEFPNGTVAPMRDYR